jgi:hypothetical protein
MAAKIANAERSPVGTRMHPPALNLSSAEPLAQFPEIQASVQGPDPARILKNPSHQLHWMLQQF